MHVEYVNHMGDDLMVVNAARVSFDKESDWERQHFDPATHEEDIDLRELRTADIKLINYLATHGHWTPFSHPSICLRVKAPIFVARQLFKHKVGMTENEVSRRYVDDEPEFYFPDKWRGRPTDGAKQGSSGEVGGQLNKTIRYSDLIDRCLAEYEVLLAEGVAPEQARMVLPQSMYTEWYWTGSLASYARICRLRLDEHAQAETREVAEKIDKIVSDLFPCSWKALVKGE